MKSQPPSKRLDLQGIRGLAILSVLGFHFFPQLFPNGYLGVDQFFVLSGFLMCMLLTKTQQLPPLSAIMLFYSKRFKRILPLYLLNILFTLIALNTIFPETAVLLNEISATKALFFVSNRPPTEDENYFEKLSVAIDLFTHTWSLSVEIQFYFIVPFIFLAGNGFSKRIKYGFYLVLSAISFYFYYISPQTVAFNSVFARIWQFLIGMVIYMASSNWQGSLSLPYTMLPTEREEEGNLLKEDDGGDNEEKETSRKYKENSSVSSYKYFFLLPMAYIVTYPIPLFANLLRPLFTVFTGILMLLSIDDAYLSNRYLTYIGDISYSLYLIHWPVYAYAKLTYPGNQYVISSSFLLSILLSIAIHETFEKWYLKLKDTSVAMLIVILFAVNVVLVNKDAVQENLSKTPAVFMTTNHSNITRMFERLDGVTPEMTFDDAERLNKKWSKLDIFDPMLAEPGCKKRDKSNSTWCVFDENGTDFKFALVGNSYVLNHYRLFLQECRHLATSVARNDERGCEPLAALNPRDPATDDCERKLSEFVEFIEDAKADYVFMFTRFFAVAAPFQGNNTDLEKDKTYLEMRSQLKKFLPNIKKKLFILDSFPRVNTKKIKDIASDVKNGKSFRYISNYLLNPSGYERGRLRHAALVKECEGKCELIDYMPVFWNSTTNMTQYFDNRGFSYFTAPHHLTPRGLELVRPIYTKICANLK